jgi:hypothetical protein
MPTTAERIQLYRLDLDDTLTPLPNPDYQRSCSYDIAGPGRPSLLAGCVQTRRAGRSPDTDERPYAAASWQTFDFVECQVTSLFSCRGHEEA